MRNWLPAAASLCILALAAFGVALGSVVLWPIAFALAAACAFAWLVFTRPYWALLATFFLLPFERLTTLVPAESYGTGGPINQLTLIKLMFGALMVIGALRVLVSKDERIFRNLWLTPLPTLLLVYALMLWMSLVNVTRMASFATNMMSVNSGVIAFFILVGMLTTEQRVFRFMKLTFYSYIIISVMGLFEAVTKQHVMKLMGLPMIERPWTLNRDAFRICGPSGDPDYYAISIIFGLMITFAVLPLFKSRLGKAFVLGVAFLHFIVIMATASRGAALSTVLALGLFWAFARFRHKLLVGATAVLVLLLGFTAYTLTISTRSVERFAGGDTSSWTERWGWISMCYYMMLDAPVRGVGSGNFVAQYPYYMGTYQVPREPESAQNTYAQMAAQNGIPTTLVYALINVVLWVYLYRVMRDTRDPIRRHVAVAFFALALSYWLFSLTLDLQESETCWIIFAMGAVLWRQLLGERAARATAAPAASDPAALPVDAAPSRAL